MARGCLQAERLVRRPLPSPCPLLQNLVAVSGSAAAVQFLYNDPSALLLSPTLPHTNIVDVMTLTGANFGPATVFPLGITPPHLQVNMHYSCVSNVTGIPGCTTGAVAIVSDSVVTFPSTLGVGLNKPLTVSIVDVGPFGVFQQVSAPLLFSYAPPVITGVLNSPVLLTDGSGGSTYAILTVRRGGGGLGIWE